ncbi:cytochrome C biogenesis protein [Sporolactobacillus sp. Y61]|uniref:Cytochrome C biogenesis protein n=1 Tax=Sporolactobacillus sp. Y61 TaxID=3160863 RepID=A0AAU8IIR4_9BACL
MWIRLPWYNFTGIQVRNKLNEAGVLTVGKYDNVISYSKVKGYWRPLEGANPYDGVIGQITSGTECKMEFRCHLKEVAFVKSIIKEVHPYEEPIINIIPSL